MSKENYRLDKDYIKRCLDEFDRAVLEDREGSGKKDGHYYLKFKYFLKTMREVLMQEVKNADFEDGKEEYREKIDDIARINFRINLVDLGLDELRKYGESLKLSKFASSIIELWNNKELCKSYNGDGVDGSLIAVIERMSALEYSASVQLERHLSNFPSSEMDMVRNILGLEEGVGLNDYRVSLKENYDNSKKTIDDTIEYDIAVSTLRQLEDQLNSFFKQVRELSEILGVCSVYKNVVIGREPNVGVCLGDVENMALDKGGSEEFISTSSECIKTVTSKKKMVMWHLKYGASALGVSIMLLVFASCLPEETYFTSQFENFLGKIGLYLGSAGSLGVSVYEFLKAIRTGLKSDEKVLGHRLPDRHL